METSLMLMVQAQAAATVPALMPVRGVRHGLARALAGAGRFLDSLSRRLAQAEARAAAREEQAVHEAVEAMLEFHAEAGAPEGALYVNGEFVGYLPGVSRL
ncbi:MAG: hypothetical protein ACKO5J_11440 [Rubrivivax sp.]